MGLRIFIRICFLIIGKVDVFMFLQPGDDLKHFEAYQKGTHQDAKGAITSAAAPKKLEQFDAVLATASQSEIQSWLQKKHPISHTIVLQGASSAVAGDFLVCNGRNFYIQGKDNIGELGFWTTFYCKENGGTENG